MSSSFTAYLLYSIVIGCCVCYIHYGHHQGLVQQVNAASTYCSTNTSSIEAHMMELDREIVELTCLKKRLTEAITVLNINATQNGVIISIRSKHLEKIENALSYLVQESKFIKLNNADLFRISNRDGKGFTFGDGSRERSCKGYRHPTSPYQYENQGSGLYVIEPSPGLVMTVYCDMTTDGGGWTLISGIKGNYEGIHFHTFEDSTAVSTSNLTSFHIKTEALLNISSQVRAATDSSLVPFTSFHQSSWAYSAACTITNELRNAISLTPKDNNGDLPATCVVLSGLSSVPSFFTYGRTGNNHSTGFRLGQKHPNSPGHMEQGSYATYSFTNAQEGGFNIELGVYYNFASETNANKEGRNGAIFLR